jgi:hypothetical protein
MKKLIPLMLGMALMFGAVTTFAHPQDTKATKATKAKKAKKSTEKKS